jgi:hypothetical protein
VTRRSLFAAAVLALLSSPMGAQERLGSGAPDQHYRAGWTFTPTIGVGETYDTNVSLSSEGHTGNEDIIAAVLPGADLHYSGKHTLMDMNYSGSYLDYRQFSGLNRWDQRAKFDLRQQESERLTWYGHVSGALLPSTDLIDLGGIPYRKTGAETVDGKAGVEYQIAAHSSFTSSASFQAVSFDRSEINDEILRGGRIFESMNAFRQKVSERMAVGADYSFRRALVTGETEPFDFHMAEAALDYTISPLWSFSGAGGVVYLQPTSLTAGNVGPAWRLSLERARAGTTFHVGYLRTFIPSFGAGGTVSSQDVSAGFRTPLFNARRLYLDTSGVFRDNQPLEGVSVKVDPVTGILQQLPLRSLRWNTILGWEPQPWVRLEVFYSLVQQTSLQVGGYLDRNRVGFQIVTSKPMRMQ